MTSVPREIIQRILELSVHAPSGENCQPWRFVVGGNKIKIFNIPERDTSLYNFQQLGSFVAHGALIENMLIVSSALGYRGVVNFFTDQKEQNQVADFILEKSAPQDEPLFHFVAERSTNRNPYMETRLTESQKSGLLESAAEVRGGEIRFIENAEEKKNVAKHLVVGDRMLFENKKVHDFLFSHILWDKKEAEEKKSGFYIKELALPAPIEKLFKLLRNWDRVLLFNKFGFSRLAAKGNVKLYANVGAIVAIVTKSSAPKDFFIAGRVMQRFWLTATKIGLSVQPVTGVLFFMQRINGNEAEDFSHEHIHLITEAYKKISDVFGVSSDDTIAMIFRIGYSNADPVRSLRLPPIIHES